jgi:hypothetical protein
MFVILLFTSNRTWNFFAAVISVTTSMKAAG